MDVQAGLARLTELAARKRYLDVLVMTSGDGRPQVWLLNAGVPASPLDAQAGAPRVATVAMSAAKVRNLRVRPRRRSSGVPAGSGSPCAAPSRSPARFTTVQR